MQSLNVLVVDDVHADRYLLKVMLESQGHKVRSVENGQEALLEIQKQKPDLILSDILMPLVDGYALLYNVRQNLDTQNIPFFFYTGTYTSDEDQDFAWKLGADGFLHKPIDLDELLQQVQSVIENKNNSTEKSNLMDISELDYYRNYSKRLLSKLSDKLEHLANTNELLNKQTDELRQRNVENTKLLADANSALKTRDNFLDIAAHELRTPLTVVKGRLQASERLVSQAANSGQPLKAESILPHLQSALAHTRRMERLISDMTDTAEAINAELELELLPLDLRVLLGELIAEERFITVQHQILLEVSPAVPEKLMARADATKLKQALGNIIDNAIKFSPPNADVRVQVAIDSAARQAIITVVDRGQGISSETRERIFQPYYQAESDSRTRRYGGLGIGLYVTKNIVQGHGGSLELLENASQETGARFAVRIPLV